MTVGTGLAHPSDRVEIFGCPIDAVTMDEAVSQCDGFIRAGGFTQHMSVNVAKLVSLQDDERLRRAVTRCQLITADGQGVVWASRLLGRTLPERVTGIDLMERLFDLAVQRQYGVFILGASTEVLARAIGAIRERHPGIRIVGSHHGFFSSADQERVGARIRESGAHMLFVAMSSPKKEYFLEEHGPSLGVRFAMGVGGAVEILAGEKRRASESWQRAGLEWLYRLLQEPRRLLPRYARSNLRFAMMLATALAARVTGGRVKIAS